MAPPSFQSDWRSTKVWMEVLPPTLAANSFACSIEEERTASAIVLCATSTPWLALSVS
jgi:hypothetical protein